MYYYFVKKLKNFREFILIITTQDNTRKHNTQLHNGSYPVNDGRQVVFTT